MIRFCLNSNMPHRDEKKLLELQFPMCGLRVPLVSKLKPLLHSQHGKLADLMISL